MNQQELKAMIRAAVARQLGAPPEPAQPPAAPRSRSASPSHDLYVTLINVGDACIIEPNVSCDHCGYCKSHGH